MAENKDGGYGLDMDVINLLVNNPLEGYFKLPELSTLSDDFSLMQATEIKIGHILMQKALDDGNENAAIEAIGNRMMEGKDPVSEVEWLKQESIVNIESAFSADVQKVYAQYYKDLEALMTPSKGCEILREAGYSVAEVNKLPIEFTRHIAVSALHDKTFDSQGPDIVARAREAKPSIIDAIGDSKALRYLGLAVGFTTGGIVITAGMSGAGFLLRKLGENTKVAKLSRNLKDKATTFVCNKLKISPERLEEKTKSFFSSRGFKGAVGVAICAGIAMGILDLTDNLDKAGEYFADLVENPKYGTGIPTGDNYGLAGSPATPVAAISTAVADNVVSNAVADNVFTQPNDITVSIEIGEEAAAMGAAIVDGVRTGAEIVGDAVTNAYNAAAEALAADAETPKADLGGSTGYGSLSAAMEGQSSTPPMTVGDQLASDLETASNNIILPDEAIDGMVADSSYEVVKDDNLSSIAKSHLEAQGIIEPTNTQIANLVNDIYDINKDIIGPDRDLIKAGQVFTIPGSETALNPSGPISGNCVSPLLPPSANELVSNPPAPVPDISKLASGDIPESDEIDDSIFKAKVSKESNIAMDI